MTTDGQDDIVAKINSICNEVSLLVADSETFQHFKHSELQPASETKLLIEVIACPDDPVDKGAAEPEVSGCLCIQGPFPPPPIKEATIESSMFFRVLLFVVVLLLVFIVLLPFCSE